MSLIRITTLACFALALGACQSLFQPNLNKPLETQRDATEQVKPGCTATDCPLVNVDTIHFPDDPILDSMVEKNLLQMTPNSTNGSVPASLKAYEDSFLRTAPNGTNSYLQAKVREQHDGLVIVELSSYLEKGNSEQGIPGRGFINYSREQHKALSLQDMLLPGEEDAFWLTARQAHKEWMMNSGVAQDPEFVKTWHFQKTPHVALTYGGVILKYDVATIAPYGMGHIELKMSYLQLNGILKPELFPSRG